MTGQREWLIGQPAEIEWTSWDGNMGGTDQASRVAGGWLVHGESRVIGVGLVTAVRPLRLVPADAIVLPAEDPWRRQPWNPEALREDADSYAVECDYQCVAARYWAIADAVEAARQPDQSPIPVPRDESSNEAVAKAAEQAYESTPYDEMAAHVWPNVVRAVEPLIAARVRAEAVAEERQRIERELFMDTDGGWVPDDSVLPVGELRRLLAAGSVLVATPAEPAERHVCSGTPCPTQHHAFYGQLCNVPDCTEDYCIGAQEPSAGTGTPAEEVSDWNDAHRYCNRGDGQCKCGRAEDATLHEMWEVAYSHGVEAVSGGSGHAERQEPAELTVLRRDIRHSLLKDVSVQVTDRWLADFAKLSAAAEIARCRATIESALSDLRAGVAGLNLTENINAHRRRLLRASVALAAALGDGEQG